MDAPTTIIHLYICTLLVDILTLIPTLANVDGRNNLSMLTQQPFHCNRKVGCKSIAFCTDTEFGHEPWCGPAEKKYCDGKEIVTKTACSNLPPPSSAAATATATSSAAAAASLPAWSQEAPPQMPNLLFPKFEPTYNLTMSTMTQTCFGPVTIGQPAPVLNESTGAFLKHWGVVALDFETEENIWANHRPKDADVMMVEQAAVMKKMAPNTQVWVYRNLVQPYANFVQLREKIEDPQYSGWFIHFGAGNDEKKTPRCEFNPRLNKQLCTDLFHTKLAWTENGHDCGDHIPCGDYVFDHRNASLREWIVSDFMMGDALGMGNRTAVDGFLLDDFWDIWSGPSEV